MVFAFGGLFKMTKVVLVRKRRLKKEKLRYE